MTDVFGHPWLGGLFQDETAAAIWSSDRQIAHMLAFEAALTRAFGEVGAVPTEQLARRILEFSPDMAQLRAGAARDGVVVPALVQQLKAAAGEQADWVHTGATSQDVIDTAMVLALRETSDQIQEQLTELSMALTRLIAEFGAGEMMGRTRMQAAMPIRVADRLITWSAPLDRHLKRLEMLRPQTEVLQLGGAVGTRDAFADNAKPIVQSVARQLGLGTSERAWHVTRDSIADYGSMLTMITGSVGKMGQDVCLMAQQGIDEIELSDGGGSSAMPHKHNPVLAELLVTLARFNATQVSAMHHALVHEQERSGAAWALEWMVLPQMAQATARSLSVAIEICDKVTRIGRQ